MSEKPRILITGGAGFIGSHIAELYQGRAEVRVLDNLRTGHLENLNGLDAEFIEADIRDRDAVRRAVAGVDYVFHLAALVSVPESMEKIAECIDINDNGLITVLEESARAGVKKLCFSTSAAVYGDNPESPKRESMLPAPKSPYAITKLDGEFYCRMFTETGKLRTACLRYFNVFGPRQDPKGAYAAAVPIFCAKAAGGEPLTIFGDGGQTRDFVFVRDVARANAFLAENDFTGVYNVAWGGKITIDDLAETIVRELKSRSEIRHLPERPGDIRHSCAANGKLLETGFRLRYSFDEGLRETVQFFTAKH